MRNSLAAASTAWRRSDAPADWSRVRNPLAALFVPLERLLLSGGDGRLALSPDNQLNAYGCRAFPRPEAHAFASSTASTISENAYACAERARECLIAESLRAGIDDAFDSRTEAMRNELKAILGLGGRDVEIVFAPSGTDAQLQALFAARAVLGRPITSIIIGADQTGSGTVFTAAGRHFSDRTARNSRVQKGEAIAGLADDIACTRLGFRDDAGNLLAPDALDAAVERAVATAIAGGRRVVLQAMDRSKFGWRAPSQSCLKAICARWPDDVQIVVDACQARLGAGRMAAYLERGYIVLLTGSKFFAGPPFSGAMLVPPRVSAVLAQCDPAPGLREYSARSDWPRAWPRLRAQLPHEPNFGSWLRWEAALWEMRAYFAVPRAARHSLLRRFAAQAEARIGASLELLRNLQADTSDDLDDEEMDIPTVFPFLLRRHGRLLTQDDCAKIYRALNRDMTASLPSARPSERRLARQICHIGQPVSLSLPGGEATAALRVSASARLVSQCWTPDSAVTDRNLARQCEHLSVTLEKIELLLTHLPDIDDSKGTP